MKFFVAAKPKPNTGGNFLTRRYTVETEDIDKAKQASEDYLADKLNRDPELYRLSITREWTP